MIAYAMSSNLKSTNMVRNKNASWKPIFVVLLSTQSFTPRETIKLINEYIEIQAEIIIMDAYNGPLINTWAMPFSSF